jgi:hypothetical protein
MKAVYLKYTIVYLSKTVGLVLRNYDRLMEEDVFSRITIVFYFTR